MLANQAIVRVYPTLFKSVPTAASPSVASPGSAVRHRAQRCGHLPCRARREAVTCKSSMREGEPRKTEREWDERQREVLKRLFAMDRESRDLRMMVLARIGPAIRAD